MKFYLKILDVLFAILKWFSAIAMTVMVILTFTEVIRRYLFGVNWIWSEELVRYLIVWSTFLGGAAAFHNGSLTCFDLITAKLSKRNQNYINLLNNTVIIVFLIFLLRLGIKAATKPTIVMLKGPGLGISMSIPYVSIPIGLFFMIIFAIDNYRVYYNRFKAV